MPRIVALRMEVHIETDLPEEEVVDQMNEGAERALNSYPGGDVIKAEVTEAPRILSDEEMSQEGYEDA